MTPALLLAAALVWEAPDGLTTFKEGDVFKMDSRIERKQYQEWQKKHKESPEAKPPKPIFAKAPFYSSVGGNEGVYWDSQLIEVKPGQGYKLTVEAMGESKPFVWIKGFKQHSRRKGFMIDCYQTRLHAYPLSKTEWREFSIGFTPRGAAKMKVRLYLYWPAGVCRFRNIRITEIGSEEMKELIRKRESQE